MNNAQMMGYFAGYDQRKGASGDARMLGYFAGYDAQGMPKQAGMIPGQKLLEAGAGQFYGPGNRAGLPAVIGKATQSVNATPVGSAPKDGVLKALWSALGSHPKTAIGAGAAAATAAGGAAYLNRPQEPGMLDKAKAAASDLGGKIQGLATPENKKLALGVGAAAIPSAAVAYLAYKLSQPASQPPAPKKRKEAAE